MVLPVAAIYSLWWFYVEGQWHTRWAGEGVTTQATVTEKAYIPGSNHRRSIRFSHYLLKYEFTLPDWNRVRNSIEIDRMAYDKFKLGDQFAVVYLKDRPYWNRPEWVDAENRPLHKWGLPLSFIFGFGALAAWVWMVREAKKYLNYVNGLRSEVIAKRLVPTAQPATTLASPFSIAADPGFAELREKLKMPSGFRLLRK